MRGPVGLPFAVESLPECYMVPARKEDYFMGLVILAQPRQYNMERHGDYVTFAVEAPMSVLAALERIEIDLNYGPGRHSAERRDDNEQPTS